MPDAVPDDGSRESPSAESAKTDADFLARANLEFIIGEMQQWVYETRLPPATLLPLLREYRARRAALDNPTPLVTPQLVIPAAPQQEARVVVPEPALPSPQPAPVPAPVLATPVRSVWSAVTEFLEERNIAALHIIGSLLLLTGVLVMIRWQWEGWGRGLLLLVLTAASGGLFLWGRKVSEQSPASGLVLSVLGALLLPLDLIAARLFGFLGGEMLDVNASALLISAVCAGVYTLPLQRTRHPLFGGMVAVGLTIATIFLPRALLPAQSTLLPLSHALTLLVLAYGFFQYAVRLRKNEELALSQPFALGAHGLIGLAFVLALAGGITDDQRFVQSLVALVTAVIYADIAIRLRLSRLTYPAAVCIVLASQFLFGLRAEWTERGCALAFAAFLLQVLSVWYGWQAERAVGEETVGTLRDAAQVYRQVALWVARITLVPFLLITNFGLFTFQLSTDVLQQMQYLIAALLLTGVLFWSGLEEGELSRCHVLYPLLAAVNMVLVALGGLVSIVFPPFAQWFSPALCGLLTVLLCHGLTALARQRKQNALTEVLDEAARIATVVTALLPWIYLPGLLSHPNIARLVHFGIVLPGLALLSSVFAWRREDAQRDRYMHLTALALGSFALYIGASAETAFLTMRLLWSALGGSSMTLAFVLVARIFPRVRQSLSGDAGILAVTTLIPLLSAYGLIGISPNSTGMLMAEAGIALLLALSWGGIATVRGDYRCLYGAGLMLLLAVWWTSYALEMALHGWPQGVLNPTRWFLYFALIPILIGCLLRKCNHYEYTPPVFHTALASAIVGGIGQAYMVYEGYVAGVAGAGQAIAETGIVHLYLLAVGFTAWAAREKQLRYIAAGVASLLVGYLPYLFHSFGGTWSFSPYWTVLSFSHVGSGALYVARIKQGVFGLFTAQVGVTLFLIANGHLLALWLPSSLHYLWALLLLPILAVIAWWEIGLLRNTAGALALTILTIFLVDLLRWQSLVSSLGVAQGYLAITFLVYTALYFLVAWREDRANWLRMAVWVATIGFLFWRSGYPHPTISVESFGLHLAIVGGLWFGLSRLLARASRTAFEAIIAHTALALTTAAMVCGLLSGLYNREAEATALVTLLLSGGIQTVLAYQRPGTAVRHLAFASFFVATYLWVHNHLGISLDTLDLTLLPLGLYLLSIGAYDLYRLRRSSAATNAEPTVRTEENATRVCALGLCCLLGPSLMAVWSASGAWWHPYLLVTECLTSIAVGIAYRLKLFLGFGLGFLVALLALKAYQAILVPGQQLLFAFYLLLLGALALTVGFFFDRQRRLVKDVGRRS